MLNEVQRRMLNQEVQNGWLADVVRSLGKKPIVAIEPYTYSPQLLAIAPGAVGQIQVPIQSDSYFALAYMSGSVYSANTFVPNPLSTINFTNSGSNRSFFNQQALFSLVLGTGGFPYSLPVRSIFSPSVNLIIDITNTDPAATNDYYFSLEGARIYV